MTSGTMGKACPVDAPKNVAETFPFAAVCRDLNVPTRKKLIFSGRAYCAALALRSPTVEWTNMRPFKRHSGGIHKNSRLTLRAADFLRVSRLAVLRRPDLQKNRRKQFVPTVGKGVKTHKINYCFICGVIFLDEKKTDGLFSAPNKFTK